MKRTILGLLVVPLISPILVGLMALLYLTIAFSTALEYQVLTDFNFQIFTMLVCFSILAISSTILFPLRKYGYVKLRHFLVVGLIWGAMFFLLVAGRLLKIEGITVAFGLLICSITTGAIIFFAFWLIAVAGSEWWRVDKE